MLSMKKKTGYTLLQRTKTRSEGISNQEAHFGLKTTEGT